MYAPGPGWAPGGAATGQEWGYIRELRFSSRFLNDVTRQDKTDGGEVGEVPMGEESRHLKNEN